jgi:hypothetical protein
MFMSMPHVHCPSCMALSTLDVHVSMLHGQLVTDTWIQTRTPTWEGHRHGHGHRFGHGNENGRAHGQGHG